MAYVGNLRLHFYFFSNSYNLFDDTIEICPYLFISKSYDFYTLFVEKESPFFIIFKLVIM